MENAPGKENTFPRLYAGSGRVPEDTARRVVFASWALLEPTEGHTEAPAAAAVREELMRCIARGELPVLCLYAGEDPAQAADLTAEHYVWLPYREVNRENFRSFQEE